MRILSFARRAELPAVRMRPEVGVVVALDESAGLHQLIDRLAVVVRDPHVHGAQVVFELLHPAGADDRAGDTILRGTPGKGKLAEGAAFLLRPAAQRLLNIPGSRI